VASLWWPVEDNHYSHIPEVVVPSKFSVLKTISLLAVFLVLTPVTLATSLFSLVFLSTKNTIPGEVLAANTTINSQPVNIFTALPDIAPSIEASVGSEDARAEIIRSYLKRYNSPLEPYAKYIVETADETGIDFRLTTAIAQQESNLCKFIPEGTYNCWGWGIHSRGTLGFSSYEEGIYIVSNGIKKSYIDKGYVTPEEIMSKYTPLSNGSWANGVSMFLEDMR